MREHFYRGMVKKYIVAFGSLFDEITVLSDQGKTVRVPLIFTQKDKFVAYFQEKNNLNSNVPETTWPRMAFELTNFNFAPERQTNPMNRIKSHKTDDTKYMWNRVPYDFQFSLYVGTRSFDEALSIVEQILPNFSPSINITINELDEWGLVTDIPIVLNSSSYTTEYEGSFENRRSILWQMDFTLRGHLYGDVLFQERIRDRSQKYNFVWNGWDGEFIETSVVTP